MLENTYSEISGYPLRVLIVEDSEDDSILLIREIQKGGFRPKYQRVDTEHSIIKALRESPWDIILCDYNLPGFDAPAVINLIKKEQIETPVIIVSGTIGEEKAVECLKLGAQDYIIKGNYSRLCPAIQREILEAKTRLAKKQAEDALHRSEEKYRAILENMEEGYYEVDLEGTFTFFNDSMAEILGYTPEELRGMNSRQLTDHENARNLFKTFNDVFKNKRPARGFDWYIIRKDGSQRCIEASVSLLTDSSGTPLGFRGVVRDITEKIHTQNQLREKEELQTKLVNAIPDIIVRTDFEGHILYVNENTLRVGGYLREELEGRYLLNFIAPQDQEEALKNIRLSLNQKIGPREYNLITKDGRKIPFEVLGEVLRKEDGSPFGMVYVGRDLSERKNTEKILREKDDLLRGIAKNIPGIIFQLRVRENGDYVVSFVSERLLNFLDASTINLEDQEHLFPQLISQIHKDDRERFLCSVDTAVRQKTPWNFEGRIFTLNENRMLWFQGLASPTVFEDRLFFDGILLDVTQRKRAEEKSLQSEEKFHKIFMTAPEGILLTHLNDGRIINVNKGFEDLLGWQRDFVIGKKTTEPPLNLWCDVSERHDMMAELRAGRDVLRREFKFRRKDGAERFGVYSAKTITLDQHTCILFILQDITDHKRTDAELQYTLESLRKAFGTTIQMLASAVEKRDPYTAGHQQRVADIARTIAAEMGLSPDRIDGIRLAASIHDIGKLSIPAEILSKPTRLTDIEYSLVKEHPLVGYEMLKEMDSAWPLAEIIYQHHERLNGSGYPRGLKTKDILLEARILAVADVLEAMASHRPYRPALGVDAALDEIEKNKGILFDHDVVAACLKLFREKGYKIPDAP